MTASAPPNKMLTPLMFSLLIGGAIFTLGMIDSLTRPGDTVNGKVIPWDTTWRTAVVGFIAAMAFLGAF